MPRRILTERELGLSVKRHSRQNTPEQMQDQIDRILDEKILTKNQFDRIQRLVFARGDLTDLGDFLLGIHPNEKKQAHFDRVANIAR